MIPFLYIEDSVFGVLKNRHLSYLRDFILAYTYINFMKQECCCCTYITNGLDIGQNEAPPH